MPAAGQEIVESAAISPEVCNTALQKCNDDKWKPKVDLAKAITYRYHNGLSYPQIAKIFGCNQSTVFRALEPINALISEGYEKPKDKGWKAKLLDGTAVRLVACIHDDKKLARTGIRDLATAAEKLDKIARLERGEATAIIDNPAVKFDVKVLQLINDSEK